MQGDAHETDYSQINEYIYLGSDLCNGVSCPIHGKEFEDLGILVELNLSVEKKEVPPDGIDIYAWIPVADYYPPSQDQFDMGTSLINEAIAKQKKVFVHCKNGHGRSPSMVAAYFIRYHEMSQEDALKLIKEKRKEIHMDEKQLAGLKEFETRMKK